MEARRGGHHYYLVCEVMARSNQELCLFNHKEIHVYKACYVSSRLRNHLYLDEHRVIQQIGLLLCKWYYYLLNHR